ncbi:hypothetical protein LSTR_LSTR011231 [Laodelphax striatellus]|uniref:Uncharacterized protein n=1 Tax=Laodelphax striatellus TaxID=195883 RepID=A0A482XM95_LAOST|nr:hypothetical protein LSTR_LSTR011231 [Laodelphax striatellus]
MISATKIRKRFFYSCKTPNAFPALSVGGIALLVFQLEFFALLILHSGISYKVFIERCDRDSHGDASYIEWGHDGYSHKVIGYDIMLSGKRLHQSGSSTAIFHLVSRYWHRSFPTVSRRFSSGKSGGSIEDGVTGKSTCEHYEISMLIDAEFAAAMQQQWKGKQQLDGSAGAASAAAAE